MYTEGSENINSCIKYGELIFYKYIYLNLLCTIIYIYVCVYIMGSIHIHYLYKL